MRNNKKDKFGGFSLKGCFLHAPGVVLGETHHGSPFSSAAGRQVSSRGSETRIWCLNKCTMVGPQLVPRSSLVCSDPACSETWTSCLERGENEQNVTQESPSGHAKTLAELKLANLSGKIKRNSGRTRGCAANRLVFQPV